MRRACSKFVVRDLKAQHERTQMAHLGAGEDFGGVELLPLVWSGTSAKRQAPRRIGPVLFKTHHSTSTVNVVVGGFGACAGVEGAVVTGINANPCRWSTRGTELLVRINDFGTCDCGTGAAEDL